MTSSNAEFPLLDVRGSSRRRGEQIGAAFADRIARTVSIYQAYFARPEAEIFAVADRYRTGIAAFDGRLCDEIEGIAFGADVDPRWIYALNARSELLSALSAGECTAVHYTGTPHVGQNWDWAEPLEALVVLIRSEDEQGRRFLTMTEPGILAKIGLNDAGFAVCLNFLPTPKPTLGLPSHVLLRALLEARSWEDVEDVLARAGVGRSLNLLIAGSDGRGINIEYEGDVARRLKPGVHATTHTNHYLTCIAPVDPELLENSSARLSRIRTLTAPGTPAGLDRLKEVLSDRQHDKHAILAPYADSTGFLGRKGTVCTIAMDLAARRMHIRRGNDPAGPFSAIDVMVTQEAIPA
ncbi:C45 family autoproteolytic acyltransferase/hydolase [Nitratireductor pacificus]|uniref:Peptidase C45 acyl-coenzyme A:6-aminopenicillanic acid acyl-transferase n=1 Tax=Nitratireductor pacificus pht-3B TaxID=391937 RepID=K2N7G2_9HYPH|nr:C45 family peptidase [Nitratireductor pacificus]EKF20058.1 peptidase C45 acyl-coenzyme A:6- aminopenicillanic acid acyl-transferase [Nitratireductor pacificus pht-3B]